MNHLPGFTRKETGVLLFLIFSFMAGMGIKVYRQHWAPLPIEVNESQNVITTSPVKPVLQSPEAETRFVRISLNQSGANELKTLPGIGPVMANRIVEYRKQNGSFQSIEEVIHVKGIGESTFKKMEPYLKLN
jgi:comEA protein